VSSLLALELLEQSSFASSEQASPSPMMNMRHEVRHFRFK